MADDDTPIEGSPTDTADVTASTYTFASTPPLNTSSIRSFEVATTSTEPALAPIILISVITSLRKRLRRIMLVIILAANK
jgi:hypothetical protein